LFRFPSDGQSYIPVANALPTESAYTETDDNAFYITQNTVWKKTDVLVFDKPVYVYNYTSDTAPVLTIEPGADVRLNGGSLAVYFGTIVAQGTEAEPISFSSDSTDIPFTIDFEGSPENGDSILSHVTIKGGGTFSDPENCNVQVRRDRIPFIETAHAGNCPRGNPAVYFAGGKVLIEYADFVDNQYADIQVFRDIDTPFGNGSLLRVEHSSLADNRQRIMVGKSWTRNLVQ